MQPWKPAERFIRLMLIHLIFFGLSWILPTEATELFNRGVSTISHWWGMGLAIAGGVIAYGLIAWRPVWDTHRLTFGILRTSLVLSLVLAGTARYWFTWLRFGSWAGCAVVVCIGLSKFLLKSNPGRMVTGQRQHVEATPRPADHSPFLVDTPVGSPQNDCLHRAPLAKALAMQVTLHSSEAPLVLSLNGSWGSGKTSLMYMMEHYLNDAGHDTAWVRAWLFDNKASIWRAILQSIDDVLRQHNIPVVYYSAFARYVKVVRQLIQDLQFKPLKAVSLVADGFPSPDDFEQSKYNVSKVLNRVLGPEKRLIVFIDDLDRCSPSSVLGTLELLKEVANFQNCVFVLGMDVDTIAPLLDEKLAGRGLTFLHKVITVAVDLNDVQHSLLVDSLLPHMETITAMESKQARRELEFVVKKLDGNPRAVKQVLNRFVMSKTTLETFVDFEGESFVPNLIAAELIRFKYPEVHKQLRSPRVVSRVFGQLFIPNPEVILPLDQWLVQVLSLDHHSSEDVADALSHFKALSPTSTLSQGMFFSFQQTADWIPEPRARRMIEQVLSSMGEANDTLSMLWENSPEQAREVVARIVNRKVNGHQQPHSHTTSGGPEQNAHLRNGLWNAMLYQSRTAHIVFSVDSLIALIFDELRSEGDGFAWLHQLFETEGPWLFDTLELLSAKLADAPGMKPDQYQPFVFFIQQRTFIAAVKEFAIAQFSSGKFLRYFSVLISNLGQVGTTQTLVTQAVSEATRTEHWLDDLYTSLSRMRTLAQQGRYEVANWRVLAQAVCSTFVFDDDQDDIQLTRFRFLLSESEKA